MLIKWGGLLINAYCPELWGGAVWASKEQFFLPVHIQPFATISIHFQAFPANPTPFRNIWKYRISFNFSSVSYLWFCAHFDVLLDAGTLLKPEQHSGLTVHSVITQCYHCLSALCFTALAWPADSWQSCVVTRCLLSLLVWGLAWHILIRLTRCMSSNFWLSTECSNKG